MTLQGEDLAQIVVEEFQAHHAESLARMWNESDVDWPGGFTAGVALTGERILSEYKRIRTAARFVLADKKNERVAASLELLPLPANPEAVYTGLNVHPDYRGAAIILVGNMWIRAIDKLVESGYRYMEMETWPTNIPSITISKQSGFFWVPGTAVKMENYFPLLMQTPLVLKFFMKYDVIECQYMWAASRDTSPKEDKTLWNGIEVFPYEWRKGKEFVKALIDVRARGITAFENQDFFISCHPVNGGLAYTGLETEIVWDIQNKTPEPLRFALAVSTDEGLELSGSEKYFADPYMDIFSKMKKGYDIRKPHIYEIQDRLTIKEKIFVKENAAPGSTFQPAHRVHSTFFIMSAGREGSNGDQLKLETGFRVQPLLDLSFSPDRLFVQPQGKKEVFVSLKNNYTEELSAGVSLSCEGALLQPSQSSMNLKSGETYSFSEEVTPLKKGAHLLKAAAVVTAPGTTQNTSVPSRSFPFHAMDEQSVYGQVTEEELLLENGLLFAAVNLKTGALNVCDRQTNSLLFTQTHDDLGPPFKIAGEGPAFFEEKNFSAGVTGSDSRCVGAVSAVSREYPGVAAVKEITMDSSCILKVVYRFENRSQHAHRFQLHVCTTFGKSDSMLVVPTREGILREPVIGKDFPGPGEDLPADPDFYPETWSAFETSPQVAGLIFQKPRRVEFGQQKMPHLTFDVPELKPMSTVELSPLYIYAGPGNWETVRSYYSALFGENKLLKNLPVGPIVSLSTSPEALTLLNPSSLSLTVKNKRNKPLSGTLEISTEHFQAKPSVFVLNNVCLGKNFTAAAELKAKKEMPGFFNVPVSLKTDLYEKMFHVPVIHPAGEASAAEDSGDFKVENDCFLFKGSPSFNGSIYSLKISGTEQLLSSYPEPRDFLWFTPWFGGISPLFMKDLIFPAKLKVLNFERKAFETSDAGKVSAWVGVELQSALPDAGDIDLKVQYLTCAGIPILVCRIEISNSAKHVVETYGGFGMFLQVGGSAGESALYYKKEEMVMRKRTPYDAWTGVEDWAIVENQKAKQALMLLRGAFPGKILAADLGNLGPHFFAGNRFKLKPGEKSCVEFYLIHGENHETLMEYKTLCGKNIIQSQNHDA